MSIRFAAKKDNMSGYCVMGENGDQFYLSVPQHKLLSEAIAALMSGETSRAGKLTDEWLEATGRKTYMHF